MIIEEAGSDDISAIRKIASLAWIETYSKILSTEQYEYMFDMMYSDDALKQQMQNHHFLLIKESTDKSLGFISFEFNYNAQGKTKIHKLYVLPHQHGKGLGRLLIDKVENLAIEKKDSVLTLNMNRYNKALDFYRKLGFCITGEEDIDVGRGYLMEDYIFEKIIK